MLSLLFISGIVSIILAVFILKNGSKVTSLLMKFLNKPWIKSPRKIKDS